MTTGIVKEWKKMPRWMAIFELKSSSGFIVFISISFRIGPYGKGGVETMIAMVLVNSASTDKSSFGVSKCNAILSEPLRAGYFTTSSYQAAVHLRV